jgi:hypothetical protein
MGARILKQRIFFMSAESRFVRKRPLENGREFREIKRFGVRPFANVWPASGRRFADDGKSRGNSFSP